MNPPLKERILRWIAARTGKYYVEDYVRVYPGKQVFDKAGQPVQATGEHLNNYLNHCKYYQFAAQFVHPGTRALDAGCGSGYGARILKDAGAHSVDAFDISEHALNFALEHFGDVATFRQCGITNLVDYVADSYDLVTCSEVLEHIKEYGKEALALAELKRVMRPNGLLVLATPNDEMLPDHGFSFSEIDSLCKSAFSKHLIIENALLPFGDQFHLWEKRLQGKQVGLCIQQTINLKETVLPPDESPQLKPGEPVGVREFADISIDTNLLHNTHSWIVLANP